jgi:hypothetical protein
VMMVCSSSGRVEAVGSSDRGGRASIGVLFLSGQPPCTNASRLELPPRLGTAAHAPRGG